MKQTNEEKRIIKIRFELAKLLAPLDEVDYYRAFGLIDDLMLMQEPHLPTPTKKKFNIKKFVKLAKKVRKTFTQEEIDKFQKREV